MTTTLPATAWPDAVLFDCDGTLADTETLSDRAWTEVLGRRGYVPTAEDFATILGHPWDPSFAYFAQRAELGDRAAFREEVRAVAARLHAAELELFPDAVATVRALVEASVPIAVVSSSSHAHVERCLRLGGLLEVVPVIVGADDVAEHKPAPRPYLDAAAALGVDPNRCTVVEDTEVGIASGKAAGAFAVAVVRGKVDPASLVDADRLVDEVSPEAVRPSRR